MKLRCDVDHFYVLLYMHTNQGKKFDQKIAHELLHISPLRRLDLTTIVNTGIEVIKAQTGNR